jgi:hypothetical protein
MTQGILGPGSATNATAMRPQRMTTHGVTRTFFKGCVNGAGATLLHHDWLNDILAQFEEAYNLILTPQEIADEITPPAGSPTLPSNRFTGDMLLALCFKKLMDQNAALEQRVAALEAQSTQEGLVPNA